MLNVEVKAGRLATVTAFTTDTALSGALSAHITATRIDTGVTSSHGSVTVSIGKDITGGAITVAAGVFTDSAPSLAKTAAELLSADDTNIITLGSDDKLFAPPIKLDDADFTAYYLLARG